MASSQMLKGMLEGCILAIISQKETYGYEISEQLKEYGFGKITEGTIYPLLLRLEKNGFIKATYRQSELGPKRKYYYLTPSGQSELCSFSEQYRQLTKAINLLLEKSGGKSDE